MGSPASWGESLGSTSIGGESVGSPAARCDLNGRRSARGMLQDLQRVFWRIWRYRPPAGMGSSLPPATQRRASPSPSGWQAGRNDRASDADGPPLSLRRQPINETGGAATAAPPRSAARTRRSRPRSAVSKVAILRELVGKAAAVRACAIARGSATKSCAIARTAAAKACAQERVSSAGVAARLAMQLARNKFDIWMLRRAQARQRRISNRRTYKKECELKRVDYELKLEEYEEWRMIQFEIKLRDIFKRMQKLGHIDPAREFPIPLRPDLYNYRPSPLPPSKPMMQTYAEYLQHVGEVVGLFNKTVKILFVSPAVSVGTVVCSAALVELTYLQSTIFKGFLLEGFKEDPSKVKQEEAEGDKAQEEASDAKQEVDKAKEEASDGKQEGDKAKEEASDGNLEGDKAKEEASDGKQEDVKASDAKQEGDKAKEEASDGKQEGDKAKEEASPK
ncbi:hypothetical protein ACQ4PT_023604 [Festuca glaucescens]